jgi:hypothetical protein
VSGVDAVLDGDIDGFIRSILLAQGRKVGGKETGDSGL